MQRQSRWLAILTMGSLLTSSMGILRRADADGIPADARVIAAWAAGPFEVKVAFDRPIGEDVVRSAPGRTISFDMNRSSVRSPAVHSGVKAEEPGSLRIAAARLEDAGRTLVLTTDPHPRAAVYSLELGTSAGKPLAVRYDLTGVEVSWSEDDKAPAPSWTGWWPSLGPNAVREQLGGSAEHARGFALLARKGKLSLNTLVILPKGPATLTVDSSAPVEAALNGENPGNKEGRPVFRAESTGDPMLLSLTIATGTGDLPPALAVSSRPGEALSEANVFLPWTPASPPRPAPLESVPKLVGGDTVKGAIVFAGDEAKCANCHKVRGEGGNVGPDLSGLVGHDREEVYRDIAEPSARIHPEFVPYTVALKDGRILVGTVRAEGADAIRVSDTDAKVTVVKRAEVDELRPGTTSIMPVGLVGVIGEEKLRDLIAFLVTPAEKK